MSDIERPDFYVVAMRNVERGFSVLPLAPGGKNPLLKGWPDLITKDPAKVVVWAAQWPSANCGVAADELTCILESDNLSELEKRLGYQIPECYTVQARENRPHFYFSQTDATHALGNRDLPGIFEFKQARKYVVAEGSVSPHGPAYLLLRDLPRYPMPDKLVADLTALLPVRPVAPAGDGIPRPAIVERLIRRIETYCESLNVETFARTQADGRVFITTRPCLTVCLHTEGAEVGGIGIMPSGALFVACFHTHCAAYRNDWATWRRIVEIEHRQPMRLERELIRHGRFRR